MLSMFSGKANSQADPFSPTGPSGSAGSLMGASNSSLIASADPVCPQAAQPMDLDSDLDSDNAAIRLNSDLPSDEDSEWSGPEDSKATKKRKRCPRKKKQDRQKFVKTTKTFKGSPDRKKGDEVEIIREEVHHESGMFRPTQVSGIVRPRETKGRSKAPEPAAGPKVAIAWKKVGDKQTRDTGIVDAQKGHLMALELGGPDIPENIVPQWAQFQANGTWRQAEKAVRELAQQEKVRGNNVHYTVNCIYKEYENVSSGSAKGVFFPKAFKMTVQVLDKDKKPIGDPQVMFDNEQAQDETDDMLAERVMAKADSIDDGSDSGDSGDSGDSDDSDDSASGDARPDVSVIPR